MTSKCEQAKAIYKSEGHILSQTGGLFELCNEFPKVHTTTNLPPCETTISSSQINAYYVQP